MDFKKYKHVVKLNNVEVEGLLDGTITYSPKLDGTNASLRWDTENNCISAFSRTRQLNAEDDNAGFYQWANSDDIEAKFLRSFCSHNPHLILFGEWLGQGKFVGHIKDYNQDALGKLWLFDMYDTQKDCYLPEGEWRQAINIMWTGDTEFSDHFPWYVPYFTMENPTVEKVKEAAEKNYFLLDNANHPGEGLVLRRTDFRNQWGKYEIGKLVLDEYKQNKSKSKKVPKEGIEKEIVDTYITDAECSKAIAKIELTFGEKFNSSKGKHVGLYINLVWNDAVLDEMRTICKKWHLPKIDFKEMKKLSDEKAREYIGL